jgi:hypothetical protein
MVYFQTKTPNLGKCLRALDWKMLLYFYYGYFTDMSHDPLSSIEPTIIYSKGNGRRAIEP